eukprot:1120309-Rhodomonas_salina.1
MDSELHACLIATYARCSCVSNFEDRINFDIRVGPRVGLESLLVGQTRIGIPRHYPRFPK